MIFSTDDARWGIFKGYVSRDDDALIQFMIVALDELTLIENLFKMGVDVVVSILSDFE